MERFEYAHPSTKQEVLRLLVSNWNDAAVLAGGTDLLSLMKEYVVTPKRVVNIKSVAGLNGIHSAAEGVTIGALVTMEELLEKVAPSLSVKPEDWKRLTEKFVSKAIPTKPSRGSRPARSWERLPSPVWASASAEMTTSFPAASAARRWQKSAWTRRPASCTLTSWLRCRIAASSLT